MVQAIKKRVIVGPGGRVEVSDPSLPEGASAEVIVLLGEEAEPVSPLAGIVGSGRGVWETPEDAEAYLRSLRNEWD